SVGAPPAAQSVISSRFVLTANPDNRCVEPHGSPTPAEPAPLRPATSTRTHRALGSAEPRRSDAGIDTRSATPERRYGQQRDASGRSTSRKGARPRFQDRSPQAPHVAAMRGD